MEKTNNNFNYVTKGIFRTDKLMCVQKQKKLIGEASQGKEQEYFYNLSFSDGENIFSCTAGKVADKIIAYKHYYLGCDYLDKKLRLVDFVEM